MKFKLEDLVRPDQKTLFNSLKNTFKGMAYIHEDNYILVPGTVPVLLVAHLDTVHKETVKTICKSEDGNILMSPQGIGGDDRCGVYALLNIYHMASKKPYILFTCDEEIGGDGARAFVKNYTDGVLPKNLADLKMIIEIDRQGEKDAVYYDCDNPELEEYITNKGFVTEFGSFSDISVIAPTLGVAAVNLSSGYYYQHTLHECIVRSHINATIYKILDIVKEISEKKDFPQYVFIQSVKYTSWKFPYDSNFYNVYDDIPNDLPYLYVDMYADLLYSYDKKELEEYRSMYGNSIIKVLYEDIWTTQNKTEAKITATNS